MKRQNKMEKRNKAIVVFIALIMISSVFAVIFYGYSPAETKLKYNDLTFTRKNEFWTININKKEALFNYFPTDVDDIKINPEIINKIRNTLEVDFTSDFNSTFKEEIAFAQYQLAQMLQIHFNIYLREGFTSENEYNFPVIVCKDTTKIVPVFYFKESNQTNIYIENDCIIMEFKDSRDIIKIKDRFLYDLFGIIR